MKAYIIIPARGGSKGIPRKNLQQIGGKSLITIAVEKALCTPGVWAVCVSTEDPEIAAAALHAGARVIPRPPALATDETPTAPVLLHAVEWLQANGDPLPDAVILIYPTSPLLPPSRVAEAIDLYGSGEYDSASSGAEDYSHFWRPDGTQLFPAVLLNRQYARPCYRENGAVYVTSPELLRERKITGGRVGFVVMGAEETIDIDTPADLERAREQYQMSITDLVENRKV